MPLADKLLEAAARYIVEIVLTFAAGLATAIAVFADQLIPAAVLEGLGTHATGRIVLGLCLVLLVLIAWVIYLHPRLVFDRRSGTYVHPKTGARYCSKCRLTKRLRSPLRDWGKDEGWQCPACEDIAIRITKTHHRHHPRLAPIL